MENQPAPTKDEKEKARKTIVFLYILIAFGVLFPIFLLLIFGFAEE